MGNIELRECIFDLSKLREEHEKSFPEQKAALGIEDEQAWKDTMAAIMDHLGKGVPLWNEIVKTAIKEYHNHKAIIFRAERTKRTGETQKDEFETIVLDGVNRFKDVYILSHESLSDLMRSCFVRFSNQRDANNKCKSAIITCGEGATLQYGAEIFGKDLSGFADNTEGIQFIGGPFMVCDNDDKINGFVSGLLQMRRENSSINISMHLNRLLPFTSLYAGYFHCYVIGDNIFTEEPHKFVTESQIRHRFIFNNADIADKLRDFTASYTKALTRQIPLESIDNDEIKGYYFPVNERTEYLDKAVLVNLCKEKAVR